MLTADERRLNELFEELVPFSGKADTVAGEIVRAASRIGYRWWNDGDMIGVGYGRKTCNPSARYLTEKCDVHVADVIYQLWKPCCEDEYENLIQSMNRAVVAFIEKNPELKQTPNRENMFDYRNEIEDIADPDYEDDWWL